MKHEIISCGQVRPFCDSVLVANITAAPDVTAEEVWTYAQTISSVKYRKDDDRHDGSCGFPFGLSPYGGLRRLGETTWQYRVTKPYCD